jgi:hypothetical protein
MQMVVRGNHIDEIDPKRTSGNYLPVAIDTSALNDCGAAVPCTSR